MDDFSIGSQRWLNILEQNKTVLNLPNWKGNAERTQFESLPGVHSRFKYRWGHLDSLKTKISKQGLGLELSSTCLVHMKPILSTM